ncbi:MAG TPA: hypothetical protein VK073_01460 [Pseudogracilibacillus sp.]|nr:hypothetical protein [Pseudogracilibacillus sp.]
MTNEKERDENMVMIQGDNNNKQEQTNAQMLSREEISEKLIKQTIDDNRSALEKLSRT